MLHLWIWGRDCAYIEYTRFDTQRLYIHVHVWIWGRDCVYINVHILIHSFFIYMYICGYGAEIVYTLMYSFWYTAFLYTCTCVDPGQRSLHFHYVYPHIHRLDIHFFLLRVSAHTSTWYPFYICRCGVEIVCILINTFGYTASSYTCTCIDLGQTSFHVCYVYPHIHRLDVHFIFVDMGQRLCIH